MSVAQAQAQFAGRVTLLPERVESFDRYPFSLPVIRTPESIEPRVLLHRDAVLDALLER